MAQERKKDRTPLEWALSYLAARPRTIREMELYLHGKECSECQILDAISRLRELGYLDDAAYARMFVESRLRTKPVSRRVLKEQLFRHHLSQECVEAALEGIGDEEELSHLSEVAAKYWAQASSVPRGEKALKTARKLAAKGYDYDDIHRVIRELEDGPEDEHIIWTEE